MATKTRHSGTVRTDYEADRARLESLQALTADTDKLLHRVIKASGEMAYREAGGPSRQGGKEGTLSPLLKNHVLTVLADIRRKRLAGYGDTFAGAQGTVEQAYYVRKLRRDVDDWTQRLEAFLHTCWQRAAKDSDTVAVAKELLALMQGTMQGEEDGGNQRYYRMLRTVSDIQANADRYQKRIEASGDTDPAVALLLVHLKNYAGIADAFNKRLTALPEIYRREMLHARPSQAVPDNAYIVVTPAQGGFTLPRGTAFSAGDSLTYKTTHKESISPVSCVAVQTVRATPQGTYLQTLDFGNTETEETLFTGGKELHTGWQIESPMLVLEDGRREITLRFLLQSTAPATGRQQGFQLTYSTAEGWTAIDAECALSTHEIMFRTAIGKEGTAPAPCTAEAHGMTTEHPTLRLLSTPADYPAWAEGLVFTEARLEVKVTGCRSFTFRNELGEADTSQPLTPFGVLAGRGAWFLFGNRETGLKPLKNVTLSGAWQKIPDTRQGLDVLYEPYGEDTDSFRVAMEWQGGHQWHGYDGGAQPLFSIASDGTLGQARFTFDFRTEARTAAGGNEYPRDKDGLFRVTLDSPRIGFGTAAYRELFAEVMMHNSRCKEKHMKALPKEPAMPQLTEVEMAYEAEASTASQGCTVRMTPVAVAEGDTIPPREGEGRLLPVYPGSDLFYMAFAGGCGETTVRTYLDMALPKDRIPYYHPDPDKETCLAWQYWNGARWTSIPSKSVFAEETEGLTQSGFVEITFDGGIRQQWLDDKGRLWLRAVLTSEKYPADGWEERRMEDADTSGCLALRSVHTNCLPVRADGGDGTPLPAGTIRGTADEDPRIGSVSQPLPGFGGSPALTEEQEKAHRTARFANRHRAVTARDYEQILMEHYPEVDMAICLTLPKGGTRAKPEVRVVVFSKADDSDYYLSAPWRLNEMERTLRRYAPACAELRVVNPLYEKVTVACKGTLHFGVRDRGDVENDLRSLAEGYFMPWRKYGELPTPGKVYSFKELRARLVNHEDLQRVVSLTVNGRECPRDGSGEDAIRGKEPWSVLIPEVDIRLFTPDDGVGENGIGYDFVIG